MVQLHDLVRDDGFEGVGGVWERGDGVRGRCGGVVAGEYAGKAGYDHGEEGRGIEHE